MVKRREVKQTIPTTVEEQIEKFAAGADTDPVKPVVISPTAKRDYKAMQLPFNQYEFERLQAAALATGRTKSGFVRYALLKMADEVLK